MTSFQPVFIDGPLKGKHYAVDEHTLRNGLMAVVPQEPTVADFFSHDPSTPLMPPQVRYTFHRVALFGRLLVVGTTGAVGSEQVEDAAFEMLLTDDARSAVIDARPREYSPSPLPAAEPSSQLSPDEALRLIDEAITQQAEFARPPRQRRPA